MTSPFVVDFHRAYQYETTPAEVWSALADFDQLSFWGWLQDLQVDGKGLVAGCTLHGVVRPPVPYQIRLDISFTRCRRPAYVDAEVSGDLQGPAHLRLHRAGSGTELAMHWALAMNQRALRIGARVAPRTMRWGHDHVVDASANALGRYLHCSARRLPEPGPDTGSRKSRQAP